MQHQRVGTLCINTHNLKIIIFVPISVACLLHGLLDVHVRHSDYLNLRAIWLDSHYLWGKVLIVVCSLQRCSSEVCIGVAAVFCPVLRWLWCDGTQGSCTGPYAMYIWRIVQCHPWDNTCWVYALWGFVKFRLLVTDKSTS